MLRKLHCGVSCVRNPAVRGTEHMTDEVDHWDADRENMVWAPQVRSCHSQVDLLEKSAVIAVTKHRSIVSQR